MHPPLCQVLQCKDAHAVTLPTKAILTYTKTQNVAMSGVHRRDAYLRHTVRGDPGYRVPCLLSPSTTTDGVCFQRCMSITWGENETNHKGTVFITAISGGGLENVFMPFTLKPILCFCSHVLVAKERAVVQRNQPAKESTAPGVGEALRWEFLP